MASIRCKACGCTYDYNKEGMCPKCGAYNRPPHRERVDPDGSVHYLEPHDAAVPPHRGKKVCYEKKTCYEGQTRRSARRAAGEPDSLRAGEWENLKGSARNLKDKFQNMEKKHRDTLIGLAIALLVLIVPFLNSCLSFRTVRIDSPEREPVYPVEEAAAPVGGTTIYQMNSPFDLMGKTVQVTEVQTDGQRVIVTVEGLQSDTTPPAFLTSYDGEDFILDIVMPDTITYLDYGTEFIYDRSTMYNSEYAVQWLLEFDLQEEQNGTMVYTGEVVAVDLTDVLY